MKTARPILAFVTATFAAGCAEHPIASAASNAGAAYSVADTATRGGPMLGSGHASAAMDEPELSTAVHEGTTARSGGMMPGSGH